MNNKEIARTLASITEEQWEAILIASHRIERGLNSGNKNEKPGMREKISNIEKRMGIPPQIHGYAYIQDAVLLVYEDETYIHNVVKKLYPAIAEIHGTNGHCVERSIRHALQVAYSKGELNFLKEIFGTAERPVNSHAIVALVEYVKTHQ